MNKYQEQQYIKAESEYLGRHCWKTSGFKTIHTGVIREIRLVDNWVEGNVYWQTRNGEELKGHPHNWERVANLGFETLPAFGGSKDRGEDRVGSASNALTPWSGPQLKGGITSSGLQHGPADCLSQVSSGVDCQGDGIPSIPEVPQDIEEGGITKTVCQNEDIHPHVKAPRRAEQSEEANRAVNYRALLALIDHRQRDISHLLNLNETLKREGCNTITLPAFKMRADKFQKSFERSIRKGNYYTFLREAFNGEWHGSLDNDSLWMRY
jgi:hypothetical protein